MPLFNKPHKHEQRAMLNAVWLRQESVATAIPGNLGSRRLPLLSIRTHGAAGSRMAYRPVVSYVGCIVQNPTASWAQISTPHSEAKSIFDFEVEFC
jgi:hypothetical protein